MNALDGVQAFERGVAAFDERAIALEPRRDPEGLPHREIRFDGVDFRYPGSDRPVLDGLDLVIPACRCTAIVGLNGAGKTTLVKLLARLYDPTEGQILLDGTDLREYDVEDLRREIGVIFQDYMRYDLLVRENIGFGKVLPATFAELTRSAWRRSFSTGFPRFAGPRVTGRPRRHARTNAGMAA